MSPQSGWFDREREGYHGSKEEAPLLQLDAEADCDAIDEVEVSGDGSGVVDLGVTESACTKASDRR